MVRHQIPEKGAEHMLQSLTARCGTFRALYAQTYRARLLLGRTCSGLVTAPRTARIGAIQPSSCGCVNAYSCPHCGHRGGYREAAEFGEPKFNGYDRGYDRVGACV